MKDSILAKEKKMLEEEMEKLETISRKTTLSRSEILRTLFGLEEYGTEWLPDNRNVRSYVNPNNKLCLFKYGDYFYTSIVELVGVNGEGVFYVQTEKEKITLKSLPWARILDNRYTDIIGKFDAENYSEEEIFTDTPESENNFFIQYTKAISLEEMQRAIEDAIQELVKSKANPNKAKWDCNITHLSYESGFIEKVNMNLSITRSFSDKKI